MVEVNERGNTIFRSFHPADRYQFDFNLCSKKKGWKQYDTSQDAWYFGVKRDLKALAEEVGRWDVFIAGFSGMLEKAVGKENLHSAIAESPRYEELKELGMQHLDERVLGQLREVFDMLKSKAEERR